MTDQKRMARGSPLRWLAAVVAISACDLTEPPPPAEPPELPPMPSAVLEPAAGEKEEVVDTPPPVSGRAVAEVTSADVVARVELLRSEAELIRKYMGRPKAPAPRLRVANAQSRAVHRQAIGMFDSANTLSFELSRSLGASEFRVPKAPKTVDVFRVADRALQRVLIAKRSLGIEETRKERAADDATQPTQAFHAIVAAAAELNNLLEHRKNPTDVFRQVTSAVHAAAAIQISLPGTRFPDEPEFLPAKTPPDVYQVLLECYAELEKLAAARKVELVRLRVTEADARDVSPNDVNDLAMLLSAETQFVRDSWPNTRPALQAFDPGLKYPAHVHQRARFLRSILRGASERQP